MKFPIGGKAREPIGRSGEIPGPTVKVWMKRGTAYLLRSHAFISLVLSESKAANAREDFSAMLTRAKTVSSGTS